MIKNFHYLSHPLSLSLTLTVAVPLSSNLPSSLYLNPANQIIHGELLDVISQPGEQSKDLPKIFLPSSEHPSKIIVVLQKEFLCMNRDFPTWAILHALFPYSALNGDMPTTTAVFMVKISLIYEKVFNHFHMRDLAKISFPADHTLKIRSSTVYGVVNIWTIVGEFGK